MAWAQSRRIQNQSSRLGPAQAVAGDHWHMVHTGQSSNDIWHTKFDGQSWSPNVRVPDQKSHTQPAIAGLGGSLYMVHLGDTSDDIWFSVWARERWSPNTRIPNQSSSMTPALAVYRGQLHMVYVGNGSTTLYHSIYDVDSYNRIWSSPVAIPGQWSKATPALATFAGRLHMVHLGKESNKLWHSTFDGERWTDNVEIPRQSSKLPPALAAFGGQLHMVHVGESSNDLWYASSDGRVWKDDVRIVGQSTRGIPALAARGASLVLSYIGPSSTDLWYTELGGATFSKIEEKAAELSTRGRGMGQPVAAEENAGAVDGRMRRYANGRIYFHPASEAHDVRGKILDRYLELGGPRRSPANDPGECVLGFPVSDEEATFDARYVASRFESGTIYSLPDIGAVEVHTALYERWRKLGGAEGPLGHPALRQTRTGLGDVAFFERGCLYRGEATAGKVIECRFQLPPLGRPHIVRPDADPSLRYAFAWWQMSRADYSDIQRHRLGLGILGQLLDNKLALAPVGGGGPVLPLSARVEEAVHPAIVPGQVRLNVTLSRMGAPLAERQLYDVVLLAGDGRMHTIAPHAVYARSGWKDFGLMHITDIHVSRRIENIRADLRRRGRAESAEKVINFNDSFRDAIRYANHLHATGLLDGVIATGDLVDYIFENDDDRRGDGNLGYFRRLVLGTAPSADGWPSEELRVPLFTVPGNHDYRPNPYELFFEIDIPIVEDAHVTNHENWNLTDEDAIALVGGMPTYSRDFAARMVEIDQDNRPYQRTLGYGGSPDGSYAVKLGNHTLVMIDTRWDVGVVDSLVDGMKVAMGFGSEDQRTFVAGSPNLVGVSDAHVDLLTTSVEEGENGVVIVAMHAPPINPKGNEFPFYFRETQHVAATAKQVHGYLLRQDPQAFIFKADPRQFFWTFSLDRGLDQHKGWNTDSTCFKLGDTDDLLDFGCARDKVDELLRLCAGVGIRRPIDLLLCGHGHRNVEYRIEAAENGKLRFFTDYYTENPNVYYRSYMIDGEPVLATTAHSMESVIAPIRERTHQVDVVVKDGAPPEGRMVPPPSGSTSQLRQVEVPPYPRPLSAATDAKAWWRQHRPLIVQTAGLGPIEASQRSADKKPVFNGFRVMLVRDDVISEMHYVTMTELRNRHLRMPWESSPRSVVSIPGAEPTPTRIG